MEEGPDSVLAEIHPEDDSKMDTIARVPKHSYYLRSIYQPELSSAPSKTNLSNKNNLFFSSQVSQVKSATLYQL